MISCTSLFIYAALSATAIRGALVSPANQGHPVPGSFAPATKSSTPTDADAIASAILQLHQNDGPTSDAAQNDSAIRTPEGYKIIFGPTDAANQADGYVGFELLKTYSPQGCAKLCNARAFDADGGLCKYFNIWQAVVGGVPSTTYTCAMYWLPTNISTAINRGQGNLTIAQSRGYHRISVLPDGGFESYQCADDDAFCFSPTSPHWIGTSPPGGDLDATIFHYTPYAHHGSSAGLLGSAYGDDALPGNLSASAPLNTKKGRTYVIEFFYDSTYSGKELEEGASMDVIFNDEVCTTLHAGYRNWNHVSFLMKARGNEVFVFRGGAAPAWIFIDDVYVMLA